MALFDFLKKSHNDDADVAPTARGYGREDEQDDVLDAELPQKQRARRRLIGAVVLVLAAVGLLPLLLDTSPKPLNPNITIQMPNETAPAPAVAASTATPVVVPAAAVVAPTPASPAVVAAASVPVAPAQALDKGETVIAAPASQAVAKASAVAASSASSAKVAASEKEALAKEAKAKAEKAAKAKEEKAKEDKADAASENTKYMILIGAFSSEEKVKNWRAKMKEAKVPSFVEHKKLADGDRILLRAGPFKSRSAAESAEKKLKALGLSTKLVEQ